jgi:uncharacterized membrane protein
MFIVFAFISCLSGIVLSGYLFYKKTRHQSLACPRENPCDNVLHSKFGKTLGIRNEILGILYFLFIATLLFFFYLLPIFSPKIILYILFITLSGGGLFSLYLIGLQAFVIKSWCYWCLGIAVSNFVLIGSLFNLSFEPIYPLLSSQKLWWVIIHNLGFILGVGAATMSDIFFFKFLKDNKVSQEEKETMDTLSAVIWAGLGVLIVSGIAMYLPEQIRLAVSAKFLLKLVVVSVIIINGILLNMIVAPNMRRLSFGGAVPERRFRRLAFALGGVSFTSWYLAFFLGSLRTINISFIPAIVFYVLLIVFVIIGSQIFERYITKKHQL